MSDIKVPEGMLKAGFAALSAEEKRGEPPSYGAFLEAALRWLSENPIVPTEEQYMAMSCDPTVWGGTVDAFQARLCVEWQRRMFQSQ